ncbi:MAG: ChaN family lipoprotein [Balneolaceae bacterium]|nr:ChaN family lipoprotein [Balneolaceae bacterium]
MKHIFSLLLAALFFWGFTNTVEEKPAYLLYTKDAEVISYSEVIELALQNDLIFFGELHNSAIAHWLQHEMVRHLAEDDSRNTIIGMEMFEADQQVLIDEYFNRAISQSSFESEARLWNNYQTDYKPIVEFARLNDLKLIATNIPRRYASAVYRDGLEALNVLSPQAKQWVAPLPIKVDKDLPAYQNMLQMAHGHGGDNLIYAQAVKDATMAHFILLNMGLDDRMFHLNGSYHSNDWEGIVWYINEMVSGYNILTINTITVDDPLDVDPDELQSADITLVVPNRMTTTY